MFPLLHIVVGEIIMNNEVVVDDTRWIKVYRDNIELNSSSEYVLGETLKVSISNTKNQFIFETTPNGRFINGECDGRRTIADNSLIKMPSALIGSDSDGIVRIWAGWAEGHSEVMVTKEFVLIPPSTISIVADVKVAAVTTSKSRTGVFHRYRYKTTANKDEVATVGNNSNGDGKLRGGGSGNDVKNPNVEYSMLKEVVIVAFILVFLVLARKLYIDRFKIGRFFLHARGYSHDR